MRFSFKDDNGNCEVDRHGNVCETSDHDALSILAIDAELQSLNIRPTRRRRAAMRSWLALEGETAFGVHRAIVVPAGPRQSTDNSVVGLPLNAH